jgi:hypothetical protein|tara:strand:- start:52 stop:303 length:252 start_codon:yes stop_codon:yes gene_type:complete
MIVVPAHRPDTIVFCATAVAVRVIVPDCMACFPLLLISASSLVGTTRQESVIVLPFLRSFFLSLLIVAFARQLAKIDPSDLVG